MSDWAETEANKLLSASSWSSKYDGNPMDLISQALRDAYLKGINMGVERAAIVMEASNDPESAEFIRDNAGEGQA